MTELPPYHFTTSEINFLAEQESITILPRYTFNGTRLIGPRLPNLKALHRQQVPVWIALILKKQDRCNVVIPDWLSVSFLKQRYDEEVNQPNNFSELPWHWLPIAKMLLEKCSDDFIDATHEVRSTLQDLREIRQLKARKGIKELNEVYLQLDGLSLMEINEIRPFIIESMNQLRILSQSVKGNGQFTGIEEAAEKEDVSGLLDESEVGDYTRDSTRDSIARDTATTDSVARDSIRGSGVRSRKPDTSYGDTRDENDDEDSDVEYKKS
ncbi:DEKNAAC101906 [Brettanomyces naardenensis]|uniref:DNA replication complex GINS protein PSF2 n=1 Tax=Brettanomyces naardenensis TaxID=13370 RepID=A0A448YJ96_BRENA|nr:DEKNAAC101906 [Brettanomyces naardenensis]